LINYTEYKSRIISTLGLGTWDELDRVQSIDKTGTINKTEVDELGRDDVVDYVNQTPNVTYRMSQMEYGSLSIFNLLANKASNNTTIDLNDFKTSTFDICSYMTDDDGTFKGTNWIPKLRLSGFSVSIGSPTALIQRNFDFVGEDWINWQGNNKYLIYKEETVESGDLGSGNDVDITISDPVAVQDPIDLVYILRVVRVRSGVSTELTASQYSYNGGVLTIDSCLSDDVIKYWYTASSYIAGEDPFTLNDTDLPAIHAASSSIYLETGNYVYRLQSINADVKLTRQDTGEVGNEDVVQRGVSDKVVTITLDRNLEDLTIEELISGKAPNYGKIGIRDFGDNYTIRIKLYSDNTKQTFKMGYKFSNLAPSEIRNGVSVKAYATQGNTLMGKSCVISSVEATIDSESGE
jgi:hypothetical protein